MKRVLLVVLFAFLLTSCSWQIAPMQLPTPTVGPVNLAGPEMAVGSTYSYVNNTLLVAVPAAEFTMGHGNLDDPTHQVWLNDFWIFHTKVTNKQYAACVSLGFCSPPDAKDNPNYTDDSRSNEPVVGVTYDQVAAYCIFLNARLPTEAEWEKAARGPKGNIYPWGDSAPSCNLLNFNNCVGKTTSVTFYPQSKSYYGALDMEGNTFEWVADWYNPMYYEHAPAANPRGPDSGSSRSVRSSSFQSNPAQIAASMRFFDLPSSHRPDLSFRCVVDKPSNSTAGVITPTILPTTSDVPSLIPTATVTPLPTLIPSVLPTSTLVPIISTSISNPLPTVHVAPLPTSPPKVCVPKVCTLPSVWNQLSCACTIP